MITVKLSNGKIFFDEFTEPFLDSKWTVVPSDHLRYNLTEQPGTLRMFHGIPDLMLLVEEVDNYVIDVQNQFRPIVDGDKAGLIVFKELNNSLELLEFFDTAKHESFVYDYLRLIKTGDIYTAYGRNNDDARWELFGSTKYTSAGKVGLIVKGPSIPGSVDYGVQFFRMYREQNIQLLRVPVDYTVRLFDQNNTLITSQRVRDQYNGVSFFFDKIPPFKAYFVILDENLNNVHTSSLFDMCGGDIYYYGAVLEVFVNDEPLTQSDEYFLGHFTNDTIDFTVTLSNPYHSAFENVKVSAMKYKDDPGWQYVVFSTDGNNFTTSVNIPRIESNDQVTFYGKIQRDHDILPSTVEPFKFHLKLEND